MDVKNKQYLISEEDCASKVKISELRANDKYIFWLQGDDNNKGRQYLCCYMPDCTDTVNSAGPGNSYFDLTSSKDFNIRTSINEYGGGSYWLNNDILYFFNKDDQNVYYFYLDKILDAKHAEVHCITLDSICCISERSGEPQENNTNISINYADGVILDNNNCICIQEINYLDTSKTLQKLVYLDIKTNKITVLDQQYDFYCFPKLNKSHNKITWLSRNHPYMPWDASILLCADLVIESKGAASLNNKQVLINIDNNSLYQPEWYDDNNIFIVSEHDKANPYWNLYLYNINNKSFTSVISGEFELGLPLWQLGTNTYLYNINNNQLELYFYQLSNGATVLKALKSGNLKSLESPCIFIQDRLVKVGECLYYIGGTEFQEGLVFKHDVNTGKIEAINTNLENHLDNNSNKSISTAEDISFTNNLGQNSYGFFYRPTYNISNSQLPPLIVMCHGGPTGTTNKSYNSKIQYWTCRGFAVVDVNYSGSTTYGKQYRDRIKNNWCVVDVADCAAASKYLVDNNLVDKDNIIIKGGSSGGTTVLTALYKYDIFTKGCAYYPVADLIALNEHTHNFERNYNDFLIGSEREYLEEYKSRSPINFAGSIQQPVLLFHGTDDMVINVEQSRLLFDKLKNNNPQSKYIEYEGEGHGFRDFENIKRSLMVEFEFYTD